MSTSPDQVTGSELIKPSVRAMQGMRPFKVNPDLHRLQWNENPFDFPADLKEEVLQRLARTPWSRYPLGFRAVDLIDAIARFYGLASDMVVVGNGSSDILRIAIQAALDPGDHMVTLAPTFGAYRGQALAQGAMTHEVALDPEQEFALPVDEILATATDNDARLIVICAPNNPTGTVYRLEDIRRIVHGTRALVIIDEAYGEFAEQDFLPLLSEAENAILIRTFSKAFAMAGVRVGYALAPAPIAGQLQKLVNTFTLSPFSEIAAMVALENMDRFRPRIETVISERNRLADGLAALPGVRVFPSGTNFLLVHLGRPAGDAHAHLATQHRLLVTNMAMYPGYEEYLRISVGTGEENDIVINGLRGFLAGAS
jgi:histidinol-phosphate aminotransferase